MRFSRMTWSCVLVFGMVGSATAKERQTVTVSYLLGPARPAPEGLRAVAVINSGVSTQGIQQDEREAKWSVMAADMIEAMLQAGSGLVAQPILVAKRSETQAVLREHDLALAGMVAGDQAAAAGKLLAVQGLITSRIVVQLDEQRTTRSTLDWMSIMGGAMRETLGSRGQAGPPPGAVAPAPAPVAGPRGRPAQIRRGPDGRTYVVQRAPAAVVSPRYRGNPVQVYVPQPPGAVQQSRSAGGGGLTIKTRDVEEISRSLTVQCSFTLIDVATGQALLQYSPPPFRKQDRRSPDFFFGSLMGEKDLDPVDHFIGELVERATQEFVSMLVPVQVQYTYELTARRSASEEALRALRADDYDRALAGLERNLIKYSDDHECMFAAGVVCELMGRPQEALQWYRRALSTKGVDSDEERVYSAAKDRLTAHLGRILAAVRPGEFVPLPAQAGPAAAPVAGGAEQASPAASASPAVPAPTAPQGLRPGDAVPAPLVEEVGTHP